MTNIRSQSNAGYTPPWPTPDLWQEANTAMAAAIAIRVHRFANIRELAVQIQARLSLLDRFLDDLCDATCHSCADNCCQRATVWYDFKDLLGFHLGGASIPAAQLSPRPNRPCRHLGEAGCALPRGQRPFVCTWYICAAQREAMAAWPPSHQQFFHNSLMALKSGRNRMDQLFMRQVVL